MVTELGAQAKARLFWSKQKKVSEKKYFPISTACSMMMGRAIQGGVLLDKKLALSCSQAFSPESNVTYTTSL